MLTRRRLLASGSAAGLALLASETPGTAEAVVRAAAKRRRKPAAIRGWPRTLGTELEYYRSDPAHLEDRLVLCKHAGYTTIQTYVPWNVHENTRGTLDFTGATHP